jgi:hypothetical protein
MADARLEVVLDAKIDKLIEALDRAERRLGQFGESASAAAKKVRFKEQFEEGIELANRLAVAQAEGNRKEIDALRDQIAKRKQIEDYLKRGVSLTEAQERAEKQLVAVTAARARAEAAVAASKTISLDKAIAETGAEVLGDVSKGAGAFGGALSKVGPIGFAAAIGIGAAAEAVKKFMEATDKAIDHAAEIGRTAHTIGVSAEFLQTFNFAAKESEVDVGAADDALKQLNQTLGMVNLHMPRTKAALMAFKDLRIDKDQLESFHNAGELFPVVATRLAEITDASKRWAIESRLGLQALDPMIVGWQEAAKRAKDLGIALDDVTIEAAERYKKQLVEIDAITEAKLTKDLMHHANTLVFLKSKWNDLKVELIDFIGVLTDTQEPLDKLYSKLDDVQILDSPLIKFLTFANPALESFRQQLMMGAQQGAAEATATIIKGAIPELFGGTYKPPETGGAAGPTPPGVPGKDTAKHDAEELSRAIHDRIEAEIAATTTLNDEHEWRKKLIQAEYDATMRRLAAEKPSPLRTELEGTAALTRDTKFKAEDQDYQRKLEDQNRRYVDSLSKFQIASLEAQAKMSGTLKDQDEAETAALEAKQRKEFEATADELNNRKFATEEDKRRATKEELDAQLDAHQKENAALAAEQDKRRLDHEDSYQVAVLKQHIAELRALEKIATTATERARLSAAILADEQQIQSIETKSRLRDTKATPAERTAALGEQSAAQAAEREADRQAHLSPLSAWSEQASKAAADVGHSLEEGAVKGLNDFNKGLADSIVNCKSLKDVFKQMIKSMEADLIQFLLKQAEAKALNALGFSGGGGPPIPVGASPGGSPGPSAGAGGAGPLDWLKTAATVASFFGFAEGTSNAPGGIAVVGEKGPELVNLPKGSQVTPNKDLTRAMRNMSGPTNITRAAQSNVYVSNDLRGVVGDQALDAKIASANRQTASLVFDSVKRAMPGWQVDYQYEQGR